MVTVHGEEEEPALGGDAGEGEVAVVGAGGEFLCRSLRNTRNMSEGGGRMCEGASSIFSKLAPFWKDATMCVCVCVCVCAEEGQGR